MSKEKMSSLTKYAEGIKNRLTSPVPEKHKSHPESYKLFLERELQTTNSKIESMKLTEPTKK